MIDTWVTPLADRLSAELPLAVALRRRLHADPRLSGDEEDTASAVCAAIGAGAGDRVAGTGRVLRLGPPSGPAVVLRAELDALPVAEGTGLPYAAGNGAMHACGHDVHCAALAAVARAAQRVELPCGLLVLLQPREEAAPTGAPDVLVDPAFTAHDVQAVIGVHVQPELPRGVVGVRPGPVNASSDELEIAVAAAGGHGAYPQRSGDPVLALAQAVVSLHHLVGRRVDPLAAAVLTVGEVRAGSAPNVIPSSARARGTLRALDPADRLPLQEAARGVVEHTAAAYGCRGTLEVRSCEPILLNDAALAAAVVPELACQGLRSDALWRSCGSDDFAHYSHALPSLMLFLGVGEGRSGAPGLHHPSFAPPDDVVAEAARTYLAGLSAAVQR